MDEITTHRTRAPQCYLGLEDPTGGRWRYITDANALPRLLAEGWNCVCTFETAALAETWARPPPTREASTVWYGYTYGPTGTRRLASTPADLVQTLDDPDNRYHRTYPTFDAALEWLTSATTNVGARANHTSNDT